MGALKAIIVVAMVLFVHKLTTGYLKRKKLREIKEKRESRDS